ncbi:hypothetical protein LMH87_010740 [Akanthomyces muscarius]|uniref:Uncharacterized protein n=1 Tax=Akanthomyces muscarius TaxID=2231603 RepID=A0A9W8QB39_AKAMU|nr:hypothetical protein LMH87_010740 [Akanthomyces muscarius]KAJ4149968.1 hypothetical protein LMH87_010740 [Akanthomyces muscarius]
MSAAEAQETLRKLTSPDPGIQLHLDVNALYVILSTQSANNACHWALYLHIGPRLGWVFHITNMGCVSWEYRCDEATEMTCSATAVSAVKIADMTPEMHEALRQRIGLDSRPAVKLQDTEQFGPLTCRTWLLQAPYELDNEGYISVLPGYSVKDVGEEASSLASTNQYLLEKKMAKMSELRKEMNSACCAL